MSPNLRVLHCLRAPLGGVLRHVADLAHGQARLGLDVGIICDKGEDSEFVQGVLNRLAAQCSLGIHRFHMQRMPGYGDISAALKLRRIATSCRANILHGHGAKGGAYARLAAKNKQMGVFYTPHGGSLHFSPQSLTGKVYFSAERLFERWTDTIIFESRYGLDTYSAKIGPAKCQTRVIHNGLGQDEFEPVVPGPQAADFLYLGELRLLKGVDVFLQALAKLKASRPASAVIIGSGPDEQSFRTLCGSLDLSAQVTFKAPMPIRKAFKLGQVMVMPSRAESFPYVILETAAAAVPLIATRVGGIAEIFGDRREALLPPGDVDALADAMRRALEHPQSARDDARALAGELKGKFTLERMVDEITALYGDVLAAKTPAGTKYEGLTDRFTRSKTRT